MNSYQKNTREKNPRYLRWLRTQPCWVCGVLANSNIDVVGAHQNVTGGKMGGKSHDFFALPECTTCHHEEHNHIWKLKKYVENKMPYSVRVNWDDLINKIIKVHIWRYLTR